MKSFALWCQGNNKADVKIMVHFNLWIEYDSKRKCPFLDVGFMIEGLKKVQQICFYMPFVVTKSNLKDLGIVLSKNPNVLCAIFNESYKVIAEPLSKQAQVRTLDDEPLFSVYHIDFSNEVSIESKYDGTILKINANNVICADGIKNYFRFRISSEALSFIMQTRKAKNSLLESAISIDKYIDFRFNDVRSLNITLTQEMQSNKVCSIDIYKTHFLLLTGADVELTNPNSSERQLENHIWREYIGFEPNGFIVANHWKFLEQENITSFIKMKIRRCNWKTILVYLAVLSIITILLNLLSSRIYDWIKCLAQR